MSVASLTGAYKNPSANLNCNTLSTSRSAVVEIVDGIKSFFDDSFDIWVLHMNASVASGASFSILFDYEGYITEDINFICEVRPYKVGNISVNGAPNGAIVCNVYGYNTNTFELLIANSGTNVIQDVYFTLRRVRTN
tara:strand:- start:774 stop:1184 length:411 start_codon:yes stop_codon:yes gene_type:complete